MRLFLAIRAGDNGVARDRIQVSPAFPIPLVLRMPARSSPGWLPLACAGAALMLMVVTAAAGTLWWPGLSHTGHPLALPGADGVPRAAAYNALVFVLPGGLACLLACWRYNALPGTAGWGARIGARLLLLAGIAWAAQGIFALDLRELDGRNGQLHAAAWMCWWLAAASGLVLLAMQERRGRWADAVTAVLLVLLALLPYWPWPAGLSQRLAALVWFGGWLGWAVREWRGSGLR
ncbi:DUF998 domain-containing protein [Luteimonas yindakuii]|nr:DUF998 domain-containing protein [Luteimonas yindakuii]